MKKAAENQKKRAEAGLLDDDVAVSSDEEDGDRATKPSDPTPINVEKAK